MPWQVMPQGIVLFRVLVRLKVFQLFGIAGISVVATTLLSGVRHSRLKFASDFGCCRRISHYWLTCKVVED